MTRRLRPLLRLAAPALVVAVAGCPSGARGDSPPSYPTTEAAAPAFLLSPPTEDGADRTTHGANNLRPGEPDAAPAADLDLSTEGGLAPTRWYEPAHWFGPTPWDIGLEIGLNGSTGTSDTLSIRTGGYIRRETDASKLATSLYYNKTQADGIQTQNNAIFKARHDFLVDKSRWTLFTQNQVFYDEFQAFDLNVNVNSGLGYRWFDAPWVKLTTSFGAGASREFGGPNDQWVPEAQFGFDWEQEIAETQRFYANVDYFPEWGDFNNYRVLSEMGLEVDLPRPSNASLKLSVSDRFDSSPEGVPPHITNYSVLLLWKR